MNWKAIVTNVGLNPADGGWHVWVGLSDDIHQMTDAADCHEELETLASIAGAFIAARALPLRAIDPAGPDEFLPVVGTSTAHLVELLRAFAPRDDTVLISGPTGAGKSRLARWCHEHSQHRGQPFELLDLLGVPEELQAAELFGWKRGAFTGAVKDNPGAIARAAKGTLFLDEIDKLSLKTQAGLLRFIEERTYRRLGDDAGERRAEVRILVGTNVDLRAAVRAGRFREDLYYRINVLPVRLLPLAERLDELPRWADYMLARHHREAGGEGAARFEPEAMTLLAVAPWPGNLRQLDNIIRRAYALLLAGQRGAGSDPVIQRRHVERALTFDTHADPSTLIHQLWQAALGFVREAARRRGGQAPLALEVAEAFRGMLLCAAVQQTGNRDEAFVLLGQELLLKSRNHHRALRRELARVRELVRVLGSPSSPARPCSIASSRTSALRGWCSEPRHRRRDAGPAAHARRRRAAHDPVGQPVRADARGLPRTAGRDHPRWSCQLGQPGSIHAARSVMSVACSGPPRALRSAMMPPSRANLMGIARRVDAAFTRSAVRVAP